MPIRTSGQSVHQPAIWEADSQPARSASGISPATIRKTPHESRPRLICIGQRSPCDGFRPSVHVPLSPARAERHDLAMVRDPPHIAAVTASPQHGAPKAEVFPR